MGIAMTNSAAKICTTAQFEAIVNQLVNQLGDDSDMVLLMQFIVELTQKGGYPHNMAARKYKGRHDRIYLQLRDLESKGVIRDHQSGSPDGRRRYSIQGYGFADRVLNTVEVEAFILGASEGYIAGQLAKRSE